MQIASARAVSPVALERFGEIEEQPVALVGCRRRRLRRTLQPLDGVRHFAPITVDASDEGRREEAQLRRSRCRLERERSLPRDGPPRNASRPSWYPRPAGSECSLGRPRGPRRWLLGGFGGDLVWRLIPSSATLRSTFARSDPCRPDRRDLSTTGCWRGRNLRCASIAIESAGRSALAEAADATAWTSAVPSLIRTASPR